MTSNTSQPTYKIKPVNDCFPDWRDRLNASTQLLSSFTIEDFTEWLQGFDLEFPNERGELMTDPIEQKLIVDGLAEAIMCYCGRNFIWSKTVLMQVQNRMGIRSLDIDFRTDLLKTVDHIMAYAYGLLSPVTLARSGGFYQLMNMGDEFTRALGTIQGLDGKHVFIITTRERIEEIYGSAEQNRALIETANS